MKPVAPIVAVVLTILLKLPFDAFAWNIPGHMMSGEIAYQIIQRESPSMIPIIRATLEKHPWYDARCQFEIAKLAQSDRDEILFIFAARWADDIRTEARKLTTARE